WRGIRRDRLPGSPPGARRAPVRAPRPRGGGRLGGHARRPPPDPGGRGRRRGLPPARLHPPPRPRAAAPGATGPRAPPPRRGAPGDARGDPRRAEVLGGREGWRSLGAGATVGDGAGAPGLRGGTDARGGGRPPGGDGDPGDPPHRRTMTLALIRNFSIIAHID